MARYHTRPWFWPPCPSSKYCNQRQAEQLAALKPLRRGLWHSEAHREHRRTHASTERTHTHAHTLPSPRHRWVAVETTLLQPRAHSTLLMEPSHFATLYNCVEMSQTHTSRRSVWPWVRGKPCQRSPSPFSTPSLACGNAFATVRISVLHLLHHSARSEPVNRQLIKLETAWILYVSEL